jgi:hypothetical protein
MRSSFWNSYPLLLLTSSINYISAIAPGAERSLNSLPSAIPAVGCNMKRILIILMWLIIFSCKKEGVNNPPYFSFDNTAREWFSDLKVHDTLKFLSNLGSVRIYEVNAIESSKVVISDCGPVLGGCTVYYRYDEKLISFNRIDSFSSPTDIKISMYPPDSLDYKNLPKGVNATARIFGAFDDYNRQILPFPDIYKNVSLSTFTTAIKTYNEVVKFNSNNSNTYYHMGWNRNYDINEVWYDRKFGFVYFKDIHGQEWIRQN